MESRKALSRLCELWRDADNSALYVLRMQAAATSSISGGSSRSSSGIPDTPPKTGVLEWLGQAATGHNVTGIAIPKSQELQFSKLVGPIWIHGCANHPDLVIPRCRRVCAGLRPRTFFLEVLRYFG